MTRSQGAARDALEVRIRALQEAAGQLDELRAATPDQVPDAVIKPQSCCWACFVASPVPPCEGDCISLSPTF